MSNNFSQYCSDYYKNGNIFLKNKYKWLCPCSENPNLYPDIKNNYRKDYQITKQILLEEEKRQQVFFVNFLAKYNYVANGNRQFKRSISNSDVSNIYSLFRYVN
jgi:hypothetical protein